MEYRMGLGVFYKYVHVTCIDDEFLVRYSSYPPPAPHIWPPSLRHNARGGVLLIQKGSHRSSYPPRHAVHIAMALPPLLRASNSVPWYEMDALGSAQDGWWGRLLAVRGEWCLPVPRGE